MEKTSGGGGGPGGDDGGAAIDGEANASGRDVGCKVDEPAREVGDCGRKGESGTGRDDGRAEGETQT